VDALPVGPTVTVVLAPVSPLWPPPMVVVTVLIWVVLHKVNCCWLMVRNGQTYVSVLVTVTTETLDCWAKSQR
jgi:hypothetical protein